jgi:hypothetical protein
MMLWIILMCAQATGCQVMQPPYVSGTGHFSHGTAYTTRPICEKAITAVYGAVSERPHVFKDSIGYLDICKAVWLSTDDDKWMIGDAAVTAVAAEVGSPPPQAPMTYAEKRQLLLQRMAENQQADMNAQNTKQRQAIIRRCRKISRFNPLTLFGHIDDCR